MSTVATNKPNDVFERQGTVGSAHTGSAVARLASDSFFFGWAILTFVMVFAAFVLSTPVFAVVPVPSVPPLQFPLQAVYIFVLPLVALVLVRTRLRRTALGRLLLHKRLGTALPVPKTRVSFVRSVLDIMNLKYFVDMTVGELVAVALFALYIAGYFVLNYIFISQYLADWRGEFVPVHVVVTGYLTTGVHVFLLFPVMKKSVVLGLFGVSYERAVRFHRWIARISIVVGLVHGVSAVLLNEHGSAITYNFETDPTVNALNPHGPTTYGYGWGAVASWLMAVMAVGGLEVVRRRWYEVFRATHMLYPLVYVAMMLHAPGTALFTLIVFLIFTADRLVRAFVGATNASVFEASVTESAGRRFVRLECTSPPKLAKGAHAGAFFYVNIPAVSAFEWHPISVSSAPDAAAMTFHILDMGAKTWTGRVADLVENNTSPETNKMNVLVKLDGPFGRPTIEVDEPAVAVLVAGGIGVTPLAPLAEVLLKREKPLKALHFVWINRTAAQIESGDFFMATLQQIEAAANGHNHLYATFTGADEKAVNISYELVDAAGKKIDGAAADTKEDVHVGPLRVEKGRPDLKELLSNIRAQHGDVASKDMAFFVCGPERVVHATREVAVEFSVPAHSETFYL